MKRIVMENQHLRKRKRLSLLGVVVLSAGLGIILVSCYPGDDLTVSDTDIVATIFDQTANFSTKLTYVRPPDVRIVTDPDQVEGDPTDLSPATEQQILSSIDQNMTALGFTPANGTDPTVTVPTVANVLVVPFVSRTTWVGSTCYPYYWDYWYGGAGACYPATYTFTTGSIIIAMLDPSKPANSQAIWAAGINGLLDGSSTSQINVRVKNAIDQAFEQSSYLGAGK